MEKSLMARAIDLLSRREYSRRELMERLRPHAQSPDEMTEVLDRLTELAWQSDQRFAEQLSRCRSGKYGSLRLRQSLREKGVCDELIDKALSRQDDLSTARTVWQRKFGTLPDSPREIARQARFLSARGFPLEIIRKILAGRLDNNE